MPADRWVLIILLAYAVLLRAAGGVARGRRRRVGAGHVLMALLLPLWGLALLWVFALSPDPEPDALDELKRNDERHAALIAPGAQAARTVPLEEAFLMNTPQKRRELMMNLLRSDPRKYLDLLLLARFNEDPETAHYATATLTEVQRQMQLEVQQAQIEAQKHPDDAAACVEYVRILKEYVDSGLLEGRLLLRQQMVLEQALADVPAEALTPELLSMRTRNLLALSRAPEARACAQEMIDRWPEDETGWLEMLRVCVDAHDRQGAEALAARAEEAPVAWSHAGRERLRYFMGKQEEAAPIKETAQQGV